MNADLLEAMSRRIATDAGGRRGPQSSRSFGGRDDNNNNNRYRENDRRMDRDDRQSNPNKMPVGIMPSIPFQMNMGNMPGMPTFPRDFRCPTFSNKTTKGESLQGVGNGAGFFQSAGGA